MPVLIRRALIAVLLLLGGAGSALADQASEAALRGFIAWVDSSPEWSASVSFVRSDSRDTYAEGVVFTRAQPDVSISIETLRLRGLEASGAGGFRADALELRGADIVATGLRYTVPSASVEAFSTASTAGFSFDPRNLMTLLAKTSTALAKAEFSDLSIPEMTASSTRTSVESGDTVETRLTYRNLSVDGLKGGVAEGLKAGPISMQVTSPGHDSVLDIDSADFDRFDIGAFAHVFDPDAYPDEGGDRLWRPILSNATLSEITGRGSSGTTLALDTLVMEQLDGRQLDKPFTRTWDRLLNLAVPEEEKPGAALDLVRSYGAWRLGSFRVDGLRLDAPQDKARFTLDDLGVAGLSSEGIDSLTVGGLEARAGEKFLTLKSLDLAGFVAPDIETLVKFAALEADIDPKMHAETIAKTFAALPRLSHLGLQGVAFGMSEAERFALESYTLDLSQWNDMFAEATDMRMTGLEIPQNILGPETNRILDTLGFEELVLGVSLSDRWTPATGADNATWTITLGDAADFEVSYALSGLTREWMMKATAAAGDSEDSSEAMKAMLEDLTLERASFSVTDRSLLERAFAFAAEVQALDVDGKTYREQMRAALPFLISAAMPPAITKLLSKPLQSFLAGGQTLVAEISPPAPLKVTELLSEARDPKSLPDRLNMTLRTEEPGR